MIPMTEITPEDMRWAAERIEAGIVDRVLVARMLNEAADCINQLRDTEARLRMELVHVASSRE